MVDPDRWRPTILLQILLQLFKKKRYTSQLKSHFLFDPDCPLWLQLGKENSLYPLKLVISCLCLTKFELKQTLDKYGKE